MASKIVGNSDFTSIFAVAGGACFQGTYFAPRPPEDQNVAARERRHLVGRVVVVQAVRLRERTAAASIWAGRTCQALPSLRPVGACEQGDEVFDYELYHLVSSPLYRTIGREPDGRDDGTHININETIDGSVFKRWRAIRTIVRPTCSNGPNARRSIPPNCRRRASRRSSRAGARSVARDRWPGHWEMSRSSSEICSII